LKTEVEHEFDGSDGSFESIDNCSDSEHGDACDVEICKVESKDPDFQKLQSTVIEEMKRRFNFILYDESVVYKSMNTLKKMASFSNQNN
jgi:hypothetical protein